jgi:membrane-associated phospholipid phosphatase
MKLPGIPVERKWYAMGCAYACFCIHYAFIGRNHLREQSLLPLTVIDRMAPFLPWTVWVYHSQALLLLTSIWLLDTTTRFNRFLYSTVLASILSFSVFIVYPTALPRNPVTGEGLTAMALRLLYSVDPPSNCFPSLHISLAVLGALGILQHRNLAGIIACIWTTLIMIATLTTKQHYLVDVIAGFGVALLCHLVMRQITFKPTSQ